jgi:hypothetical protein
MCSPLFLIDIKRRDNLRHMLGGDGVNFWGYPFKETHKGNVVYAPGNTLGIIKDGMGGIRQKDSLLCSCLLHMLINVMECLVSAESFKSILNGESVGKRGVDGLPEPRFQGRVPYQDESQGVERVYLKISEEAEIFNEGILYQMNFINDTHGADAAFQERTGNQFPCCKQHICPQVGGSGAKTLYQCPEYCPGMPGVAYVKHMKSTLVKFRKKRPYGSGFPDSHFPGKNSNAAVFKKHLTMVD